MLVSLYTSVGGHACDLKHHVLMHPPLLSAHFLSTLPDHTKKNTDPSILIDALADLGCSNSNLGPWVILQLSPIILNWDEVGFKGKNAEGQQNDLRYWILWSEKGSRNSPGDQRLLPASEEQAAASTLRVKSKPGADPPLE